MPVRIPVIDGRKICPACGADLPATPDYFDVCRRAGDKLYLRGKCKKCENLIKMRRYHLDPAFRSQLKAQVKVYQQNRKVHDPNYYRRRRIARRLRTLKKGIA